MSERLGQLSLEVTPGSAEFQPLAERMRPRSLEEFVGQAHLLGEGRPLRRMVEGGSLHSVILWGPPGSGKTTLARLVAGSCDAQFIALSAVMAGVKDVRAAVDSARRALSSGRRTVLFLDEVHRFNKAQQDAFLPFVEDGTLVFIGATTENPSFALNNALLSRARTYVLRPLSHGDVLAILQQALGSERGFGGGAPAFDRPMLETLARAADGDARRALTLLDVAVEMRRAADGAPLTSEQLEDLLGAGLRRFDRGGDAFYDQISALHKAVRGSDPDAALYWLARMLDGGCDPAYIGRRLLRMASEDIGNADPRAMQLTLAAWQAYERLGAPEGELALAQACVFLACAAKSNAVYLAYGEARADVAEFGSLEVPLKLRNAPTRLMKDLGYGREYRYAHEEEDAFAAGERYLPDELPDRVYYRPTERGLESRIGEKLSSLREANRLRRSEGRDGGSDKPREEK